MDKNTMIRCPNIKKWNFGKLETNIKLVAFVLIDNYCEPHQVGTNIEVHHPWILGLTITEMVYKG